ncbi:MAG TPA: TIGR04086 family membrane protein [Clostridiales bacterium]|jgi:putative membrane protein (TIGR04086 family)|nr:TIGR04086 family membrane protein [Clostridiales bacterium]
MSFSLKKEKSKPAEKSNMYLEVLKGLTIALIISLVLILAMALIITFVDVSDTTIAIINQIIKAISLLIASIIAFKEKSNGWKKGLILGVIYIVAAFLIFSLMDGKFTFGWNILFDLIAGAVMGIICGIFAVNKKRII